jgi:hypothetical protein
VHARDKRAFLHGLSNIRSRRSKGSCTGHEGARLVLKRKRPAAIRRLDSTGKVPVILTTRMDAIRKMKPWQDRRTLISRLDQRPAVLRMVFVFGASVLS